MSRHGQDFHLNYIYILRMSIFMLILLSVALNLILYQASSSNLGSSVSVNNFVGGVTANAKVSKSKTAVLVLFGVP